MRFFYSLIITLILPLVFIRLWWRGLKQPAYRQRWLERLGIFNGPAIHAQVVWVHAVSVGETMAAIPLIQTLLQRPDLQLVVTTTTPTGSDRVKAAFGQHVFHIYAPYDLPCLVHRFIKRIKPSLCIIMETELWPNIIEACARSNIPLILANARLSEKSARGYARFSSLTRPMLTKITTVAAQYSADAERFIRLGLPASQCETIGNIKFDITIDASLKQQALQLKHQWSMSREKTIWIAASTHIGEDELILAAFKKLKAQYPTLLLVLVPRHLDRFFEAYKLCEQEGFNVIRHSEQKPLAESTDIIVGDTMGELMLFYGAADIVFMGGTFVANGGHNFIEPAAWALPLLSGPSVFNFATVADMLIEAKALNIVSSVDELAEQVAKLLEDVQLREQMGQSAQRVAMANRGALDKLISIVDSQLNSS